MVLTISIFFFFFNEFPAWLTQNCCIRIISLSLGFYIKFWECSISLQVIEVHIVNSLFINGVSKKFFVLFYFPVLLLQNDHSLFMTLTSLCCSIFDITWSLSDLCYGCWMALLSLNFWMVVGFGSQCPLWVKTEKDHLHWTQELQETSRSAPRWLN